VETECQFAALARAGCDEAQGYYFSPPRPAADIPAMVARVEAIRHQDAEMLQAAAHD
jgi:EAL domain-containing protein (putative c-di-GMP-specific phosphodiesterase class I)